MKEFRAQNGNFVVGEVTIDMVCIWQAKCEIASDYVKSWLMYVYGCPGLPGIHDIVHCCTQLTCIYVGLA